MSQLFPYCLDHLRVTHKDTKDPIELNCPNAGLVVFGSPVWSQNITYVEKSMKNLK
jgi:hypothetical protein